jgi:YVTN family beta-propeller protein
MAESPASNYLFVANAGSGEVTILDIETRRLLAVVPVGREPACIGLTPDQQYALVPNRASGDVAIIRVGSVAAKRTRSAPLFTMIPVGSRPVSVAVQRV